MPARAEFEYEDLEIEISRCACGQWELRILESPFNRPRARLVPPYSREEFVQTVSGFEDLLLREGEDFAKKRRDLARAIGERLFETLTLPPVGETFKACLREVSADEQQKGLRIRISFADPGGGYLPELLGLPWELLRDPRTNDLLSCGAMTQVVRYLETPRRIPTLAIPRPLKVLAVLSSPKAQDLPCIDRELEEHRQGLKAKLQGHPDVRLHFLEQPTLSALRQRLTEEPYHVLHFLGHGDFLEDSEDGLGELYFENPDRSCRPVRGRELVEMLEGTASHTLRIAVINACQGATMPRQGEQYRWAGVASALVASGFPAVVAMQFTVSAEAAFSFSAGFYRKLAEGESVVAAVAAGRVRISDECGGLDSFEWATPVLTMQSKDGRIFRVEEPEDPLPLQIGILSIDQFGGKQIRRDSDELLDLTDRFPGEQFHQPEGGVAFWNQEIGPDLREFLDQTVSADYPNIFNLAAQQTIAFAAGYFLQAKAGVQLAVLQRGEAGTSPWRSGDPVPEGSPDWQALTVEELAGKGPDLAVAIGTTWSVQESVRKYLASASIPAGRLLNAELEGTPGQRSVQGGGHAFTLAQKLANRLHELRDRHPEGTLHLFAAAPNAFLLFLGRLSGFLGPIQLYEFVRESRSYAPSMTLPLPESMEE